MISDILASIELGVKDGPLRFISAAEIMSKAPCRTRENPFCLIVAQKRHSTHFGVSTLFVLTVTRGDVHKDNIMQAFNALTAGKGSPIFLFKTMGSLGDGMKAPPPTPHILFEP